MPENFEQYNLENYLELTGDIPEDRTAFYDLAYGRIKYQSRKDNLEWQKNIKVWITMRL